MSFQHYIQMLVEGQTVAVDMAFVPEEFYVPGTRGPEWYCVTGNIGRLLHSGVDIFTGFAQSQARRYSLKAERLTAIEAAVGFFSAMEDMHGPNTKVREVKMDLMSMACEHSKELMSFPTITNPGRGANVTVEHFECCDRKVPMNASVKEAANIYRRASEFYGKRARLAQNMGGQDWKALMHAVRIVREAEELLLEGKITFPRPEAETLLAIRKGELPHEHVMALIEDGLERVDNAKLVTVLPDKPDYDYAEDIVASFYRSQVICSPRKEQ